MGTAVESRGEFDVTALRHVLSKAVMLGLFEALIVVLMSFITRFTAPPIETILGAIVLLLGLSVVVVMPGLWTRARTIEGIAGAAGIGLGATVVFMLVDVALLQPAGMYTNRWAEIGGFSNWWYHPVWWMLGTFLPWFGAMTLASRAVRGKSVSIPGVMIPAVICAVILAIIAVFIRFPGARWSLGTFGIAFIPGLALAELFTMLGRRPG
ncbi:MAG TPA: hypothetical protein VFO96_13810 [Gemmatimonadales bacterium]|jgi:hypothetical protein|nr:hypothetical protein [Gemmatimonadales bacterium]